MSGTENVTCGSVKWFNKKSGYGFITPKDGGTDVFVHHTGLHADDNISKYLTEGEFVQYSTEPVEGDDSRIRAVNVQGMNGGPLVCQTRRQSRGPRQHSARRPRAGDGMTYSHNSGDTPCGWKLVEDADNVEEKVFQDRSGDRWRLVRCETSTTEVADE